MTQSQVWIVTPDSRSLNRLLEIISGTRFSWAYFGLDFAEHSRIRDLMAVSGTNVSTAEEFHRSSRELREHYLTFLYEIGRGMGSLCWWVSSVACRNGILSKTFHRICLLKSALDLARSRESNEPLVLIAPEPLSSALEQNLKAESGIRTRYIRNRGLGFLRPLRDLVDMGLHRSFFLARNGLRIVQARRALPSVPRVSQPSTVILSWVTPDNRHLRDRFHESFFGNLAQKLQESGHNVAIAPVFLWGLPYRQTLQGMLSSPFPLVVPHRFLRFGDLLAAAASTFFKSPQPEPVPSFRGLNVEHLIRYDLRLNRISNASADALLVASLVRRLAAARVPIDRFIYIYENHPGERALCWEVRRSYPQAQLVGYQHARAPMFEINLHIAPEGEMEAPLPDRIVAVGKYTANNLARGGFAEGSIVVGGALQMTQSTMTPVEQVRESDTVAKLDEGHDGLNKRTILVASSDSLEEATELAYMAANLGKGDDSLRVILKCHPRTPYERVSGLFGSRAQGDFQVSTEPIIDLIKKSSVMVYSGSTVGVQAMALGIPAIHVTPQFELDVDPLEGVLDIRLAALGLEDLRVKVRWILDNRESYIAQHRERWRTFVDEMYSPVNERTVTAFTDLLVT